MQKWLDFMQKKYIRYPTLVIAGSLFLLALAPYYQIWICPILFSFLFWQINRTDRKRYLFIRAFSFGFGVGAVSTAWLANAVVLGGDPYVFLVPLVWIGMGFLFGLFYAIPAVLVSFYPIGYRRLLAWAALLTLFEWIRSWFLTGFPWNLIGSVWENVLPVLQSASVWGVYGLTFLTIVVFSAPALWPQKRPILAAVMILGTVYGFGAARLYTAENAVTWGVRLRLVQPNIPQTLKWDPQEAENSFLKLMRLSRQNNKDITHVLWPESAVSFVVNNDESERLRLMQAVHQGGTLIMGGIRAIPGQVRQAANSLFVLDDLANIRAYYDKSHLVPFGEYVPLRGIIPVDKLVPISFDFTAGRGVRTVHSAGTPPFGALVCYEVIFSGQVVDKSKRPEWLVNLTNDGWYGNSAGPFQHLGMARMRAVEEGLPLVRVANTGVSAVFDGYGRLQGSIPLDTVGVLDTALPAALKPTVYSRYGVWIPILICLAGLLFLRIRRK